MQVYNFSIPVKSFLKLFILFIFTSCGTYQYSGNMNDDVYGESTTNTLDNTVETIVENPQNLYFQNAFSERSQQYQENQENDVLFTDAEQYSEITTENDSTNTSYGPWGESKSNVTINIIGSHSFASIHGSRRNYPSWLWNYGYGYGNVYGYGVQSWGFGYDMYWTKPYYHNFHNGLFFPFWNYNMGWNSYGYGYYGGGWSGYGWNGYGGYPYYYNNFFRSNTNIAYVSGRRGSSNFGNRSSSNFSSRVSNNNSRISERIQNTNLRDRTSRVEKLNQTLRAKPNYYNKPSSNSKPNYSSKPSRWQPSNSNNSSKPRNNYNNSKPSYNSSPSYNNSSSRGGSSPSFNSSSPSRGSGGVSSGRSGKGGGN